MARDDYPNYPGGNYHPENDSNPYNGANNYGDGSAEGYAGAAPYNNGRRMVQGDGKVRVMESVGYGFRTVFASPLAWIVTTLVVGILSVVIFGAGFAAMFSQMSADGAFNPETGATPDTDSYNFNPIILILFTLIMIVVQVMFATAALKAADGKKITFTDFFGGPNFVKALVFVLIVDIITSAVPYLLPGVLQIFVNIALIFVGPLYMLMYLFVLDRGASFGDAARQGFQAGTRNYLPLLGFSILWGLILIVSAIPLGLGMLITGPAYITALAYVYRQASGGVYPED
ncbi:hypothetical protein [Corynebacterium sp. CCM 9203]|uniref:hypothetical protein n=1 Tax=Corynebacterium sp. CCM 9203 TaxID=3057615 RepID=UPI003523A519